MPIYEYRCNACGMEKEFLQKISDPLLTTCPACGKEALVKKLTAAGFQLKGSGWYVTDFRNNGSAPTTKDTDKGGKAGGDGAPDAGGGGSAADPGKSESPKTDPKPAAAPSGTSTSTAGSTSSTGTNSASSSTAS